MSDDSSLTSALASAAERTCLQCHEEIWRPGVEHLNTSINRLHTSLRERPRFVWALAWFVVSTIFAVLTSSRNDEMNHVCNVAASRGDCVFSAVDINTGSCNGGCTGTCTGTWAGKGFNDSISLANASNYCRFVSGVDPWDCHASDCTTVESVGYIWSSGGVILMLTCVWVGLNMLDATCRLLATAWLMTTTPGLLHVDYEANAHTLLVRVLGGSSPLPVLWDFGVTTAIFSCLFNGVDISVVYLLPLWLLFFRAPHFTSAVPILLVALSSIYHSSTLLFSYLLPLGVWAVLAAGFGTVCWGGGVLTPGSPLSICFDQFSYSLKTVVQIMTYDSWTAIVNEFINANGFPKEEDEDTAFSPMLTVCTPMAGVLWCYAVAFVFGLLFMNLLTGAFVEAVNVTNVESLACAEQSARRTRRSSAACAVDAPSKRSSSTTEDCSMMAAASERTRLAPMAAQKYGSFAEADDGSFAEVDDEMEGAVQARLARLEASVAALAASQQRVEALLVGMATAKG